MNKTIQKKKSTGALSVIILLIIMVITAAAVLIVSDEIRLFRSRTGPQAGNGISIDGDIISLPPQASEDDELMKEILANSELYTPELIKLYANNPDARDFVLDYPNHTGDAEAGELTDAECSGGVPLLLQWDKRWGYIQYGSGPLGITGCGPTCLSMVAVALTGDRTYTPAYIASFSEKNEYYVSGSGTTWTLMTEGSAKLGLVCEEVPLWEDSMAETLAGGRPIIANMGPGDFTDDGHYIVITGYSDGQFRINDPNSPTRSSRGWSYSELEGQIRALWTFSA